MAGRGDRWPLDAALEAIPRRAHVRPRTVLSRETAATSRSTAEVRHPTQGLTAHQGQNLCFGCGGGSYWSTGPCPDLGCSGLPPYDGGVTSADSSPHDASSSSDAQVCRCRGTSSCGSRLVAPIRSVRPCPPRARSMSTRPIARPARPSRRAFVPPPAAPAVCHLAPPIASTSRRHAVGNQLAAVFRPMFAAGARAAASRRVVTSIAFGDELWNGVSGRCFQSCYRCLR